MKVRKNSGEIADFNPDKLRRSLLNSGVAPEDVAGITAQIRAQLYDGIPTRQIYKAAGKILGKMSAWHAARYNLKSALQLLGPAGFLFEKFMARLFEAQGYKIRLNQTLKGKCVWHEIDVALRCGEETVIVECKFHSSASGCTDVKVPLYILSRFNDLKYNSHPIFSESDPIDRCLIVTNNRFTSDAIAFATCSGLGLLSWDYPANENIKSIIDRHALYPITCLTTLSHAEKEQLLALDIVLTRDLTNRPDLLEHLNLSPQRQKTVMEESIALCKIL